MNKNKNSVSSEKGTDERRKNQRPPRKKSRPRPKQVEVDIPRNSINSADMPHVITSSKADNDPSWYTNIPSLSRDVGTLYMSQVAGLPFDPIEYDSMGSTTISATAVTFPGIMTLEVSPAYGESTTPNSALNVAAEQLYNIVRRENSGAKNYDKTDLMALVIGMDSAYMLYESLVRVYRLLGSYDADNRYYPDPLIQALGFNPSDLRANYANFKAALDLMAYRLASINIPDQFDVIKRHSWLFSNVYRDASETKSQLYAFIPGHLYKWNEANMTENNLTILTPIGYTSLCGVTSVGNLITFAGILQAIDTIITPLMGSEDVGVISGDLAKAFGANGMIKFKPVSEMEPLFPVYSEEVLMEIENATYLPYNLQGTEIKVESSNLAAGPYLKYQPAVTANPPYSAWRKKLLNFHKAEVNVDDVLLATRFTVNLANSQSSAAPLSGFGTELVSSVKIWLLGKSGNVSSDYVQQDLAYQQSSMIPQSAIMTATKWSKFDWAPTVYFWHLVMDGSAVSTASMYGTLCDVDNFAWVDSETIAKINNAAVMSMFKVKDYQTNM